MVDLFVRRRKFADLQSRAAFWPGVMGAVSHLIPPFKSGLNLPRTSIDMDSGTDAFFIRERKLVQPCWRRDSELNMVPKCRMIRQQNRTRCFAIDLPPPISSVSDERYFFDCTQTSELRTTVKATFNWFSPWFVDNEDSLLARLKPRICLS